MTSTALRTGISKRSAIVYVWQSNARQVRENAESTALQRGLREKAIAMGERLPRDPAPPPLVELESRLRGDPPLTREERQRLKRLSEDFSRVWSHPQASTKLQKQLLRVALVEVVVRRDGGQLVLLLHWAGNSYTELTVKKRATPVGSKAEVSLTKLVAALAFTLDDGQIARVLNMKGLRTPRDLRGTKDRVQAFRSHHRIRRDEPVRDPDILTGQQAREYLGIGYHGLTALIERGLLHANQVTDFAPWSLSPAELDSEEVQAAVRYLRANRRLPSKGESPQGQPAPPPLVGLVVGRRCSPAIAGEPNNTSRRTNGRKATPEGGWPSTRGGGAGNRTRVRKASN